MCGRYAFYSPHEAARHALGLAHDAPLPCARYNIAPSQQAVIVRAAGAATRESALLTWGLVPAWAKERAIGNRMINARLETAADKPAFRAAWRRRRCLVPADGYYEWRATPVPRQPFYFATADGRPFAMAGLWEHWRDPGDGAVLESFAILTTAARGAASAVHERMPLIVPAAAYEAWLREADAPDRADWPDPALVGRPVSRAVNNPAHEGPALIAVVA